jgi:hypothetical protein
MHRCECTIFLNAPASIPYDDYIKGDITDSPWIYSEIAMTTMLQKRTPQDHRRSSEMAVDENLRILYEVNLTHLTELESSDLVRWEELCPEPGEPLLSIFSMESSNVALCVALLSKFRRALPSNRR